MSRWKLPNYVDLAKVAHQIKLFKKAEGKLPCIFYSGKVIDHFDKNKEYDLPGSLYVLGISSEIDEIELAIYIDEELFSWKVKPVKPYTFELLDEETNPSTEIYDIPPTLWPEWLESVRNAMAEELDPIPSVSDYVRGFKAIQRSMADSHFALLKEHYRATDLTITATDLAKAVGYKGFQGVNLQYGKMGKMLRTALNYTGEGQESYILAYFIPPGEQGNTDWLFIMHEEVAEALELLGWVKKEWKSSAS